MGKCIDLTGARFGRLIVISRAENYINGKSRWNCLCDCGNLSVVSGWNLKSGKTQSCGCLWKEKIIEGSVKHNKKQNEFWIENDIVFVSLACSKNTMKVDLDVWNDWAKDYRWRESKQGYAYTQTRKGRIFFHVYAFPDCPAGKMRDHIDGNRLNNTRANIRFVTSSQNTYNRGVSSNNTSGCSGVYFHKDTNKWAAEIKKDHKKIHLGLFSAKEEAIKVRKQAEVDYYGEYRRI